MFIHRYQPLVTALLGAAIALSGCTDLGEYALQDGEIFRGEVIGDDEGTCVTGTVCSFIRRGFGDDTVLELDFDPTEPAGSPGTLTTLGEPCGATCDATPRGPIAPLAHDQLSLYDFPGPARVRNFIYALQPTSGPLVGRDPLAFVSLLRGGDIEVRIVAGAGLTDCAADDCAAFATGGCDYFGVFQVRRTPR